MSPRAAWRLESLGFTEVYEYSAGKSDWGAYGLPLEGKAIGSDRLAGIGRPARGARPARRCRARRTPDGMMRMGELPVDFTRDDENGRPWRLSEHLGDSVVLLFLRGDW